MTFDDGPIPEVTPMILDTLAQYNVKATFFCVGENIEKNKNLFDRLINEGHQIGNHTYNHLKGWDQPDDHYLTNINRCQRLTRTKLFRPPYARAKQSQLRKIYPNFEVVFWDVLSGDFDLSLSPEKCLDNVIRHTRNGSIIVFHDNIKALPRVRYALPRAIAYFQEQGYSFGLL